MRIEFQFNSVQIDHQGLQEYFPNIISAMQSYPILPKKRKRRKRRPKVTAGQLIDRIIADVEQY